ncbi:MAG: hypothetical protein Q4G03_01750 [Planctomycetia bacterium]|nr:hypothetical protein [Planctomycetia bacterium]
MKIYLIGDAQRIEFQTFVQDVTDLVARTGAELVCRSVSLGTGLLGEETLSDALRLELREVDFFILLRSYPNDFCQKDVEALHSVAPLAPVLLLAGDLCAGENRTGETFPCVRRLYLSDWRAYGRAEFESYLQRRSSRGLFTSSQLSTNVDLLVNRRERHDSSSIASEGGRILVIAYDPYLGKALCDACKSRGLNAQLCRLQDVEGSLCSDITTTRVFLEAYDLSAQETREAVARVRKLFPHVDLTILSFSPYHDERAFYERLYDGAFTRVASNPFDLDYLLARQ